MGRAPCCSKVGLHRGPWSSNEDKLLTDYIQANGEGQWRSLPKKAGLLRCGKSCRLRWMNYLRPGIKRGNITADEEDLIIRLQSLLGNRWSLIAARLPGRTDNEIKNHWNTHLLRRLEKQGIETRKSHQSFSKKTGKYSKEPKKMRSKKRLNHANSFIIGSRGDDHAAPHDKEEEEELRMTNVHRSKVCSGISTSNSFASVASGNTIMSSLTNQEVDNDVEDETKTSSQVRDSFCSSFQLDDQSYDRRTTVNISDESRILFYDDWDISLLGGVVAPMSDNLLDKVYDEYLQLL